MTRLARMTLAPILAAALTFVAAPAALAQTDESPGVSEPTSEPVVEDPPAVEDPPPVETPEESPVVDEPAPTQPEVVDPPVESPVDPPVTAPEATLDPDPVIDPTTPVTVDPTADPTVPVTVDPIVDPTASPTADPTNSPSTDPTAAPTTDPGGPVDLDCEDFATQSAAQRALTADDPHHLDWDRDGVACEDYFDANSWYDWRDPHWWYGSWSYWGRDGDDGQDGRNGRDGVDGRDGIDCTVFVCSTDREQVIVRYLDAGGDSSRVSSKDQIGAYPIGGVATGRI